MDTHHILIESIAQKADAYTQQLFDQQRKMLDQRNRDILAKATIRGHLLEGLVNDWKHLERSIKELEKWLSQIEMEVPSSVSDESQESVQRAIHKYQVTVIHKNQVTVIH